MKHLKELKEAIAHATDETVEGLLIHQPKRIQVVRKETHVKKPISQNHNNVYCFFCLIYSNL